jgi:hypothetical protein
MYTFTRTKTIQLTPFTMKKLFYSSLIVFLFFACGKKDNDPTPSPNTPNATFAFLKDNHQWNYDYDALGTTGTLSMLTDSVETNLYKITNIYDSDDQEFTYWFVSGPYLKTYQDGETKANGVTIYKSNPSLNDNWSDTDPSDNTTTYYKVTNTDTTIVTSVGTFTHCKKIKVTFSYAFNTQYNYWNETYGLVYQTGYLALDLTGKNFRLAANQQGYTRW